MKPQLQTKKLQLGMKRRRRQRMKPQLQAKKLQLGMKRRR
jgi:hypothetical protein